MLDMSDSAPPPPPAVAPVLSTPDTHVFEDPTPPIISSHPKLDDEQLHSTYEIDRTVEEIREGKWKKIALQFPDGMLSDAPRVYEQLQRGLKRKRSPEAPPKSLEVGNSERTLGDVGRSDEKFFILADTSYGACCVDEIAAEHADADVVVHYGRSCLSPTARLPVIYVYTNRPLNLHDVVEAFQDTYPDRSRKVILMADIPYASHLPALARILEAAGYVNVFTTDLIHDPSSPLPNRTIPPDVAQEITRLRDYQIFHVSDPPTALLLTLSARAGAIHIFPTTPDPCSKFKASLASSTKSILRRRYALLTSLTTTPIFGILINTLSVKNYVHMVSHVQRMIAAAGKKSYTFVVGKVNAAKIANFNEVGGWVVIGCWESSLVENVEFYRPVITPWELELALKGDTERVWTGEWKSDFQSLLEAEKSTESTTEKDDKTGNVDSETCGALDCGCDDDEAESEPPEFDLRTGKYVSHSRPMRPPKSNPMKARDDVDVKTHALARRSKGDVIHIGGVASPGAEFLREKRTWQGLGSDFEIAYQDDNASILATRVEVGRSGIARGYTVGEEAQKT